MTSNSLKKRFNQHDYDVKNFLERGKISTKFQYTLDYAIKISLEKNIISSS